MYTFHFCKLIVAKNLRLDEKKNDLHQAQVNIVVAFSEDDSIYPSGPIIVSETRVWPGASSVLKALDSFRPLFDSKMAEIPNSLKEKIYLVSECHSGHACLCLCRIHRTGSLYMGLVVHAMFPPGAQ
jgi:hypothetical protein